jgi:hypothetical protein
MDKTELRPGDRITWFYLRPGAIKYLEIPGHVLQLGKKWIRIRAITKNGEVERWVSPGNLLPDVELYNLD